MQRTAERLAVLVVACWLVGVAVGGGIVGATAGTPPVDRETPSEPSDRPPGPAPANGSADADADAGDGGDGGDGGARASDGWTGPDGPQRDLDGDDLAPADGGDGLRPAATSTADAEPVRLLIVAASPSAVDLAAVREAGGTVEARYEGLVEVRAPADRIARLRALPWVERVGPAPRALPAALSEGVAASNASAVHDLNVTGEGVTVGVLDVGFDASADNVSDQVLAAEAFGTTLSSRSDHGTAVAETVAETAPGAGLYLAAFEGAPGHRAAVDWLLQRDVDVIVMAYSWPFQPADGTGWASRQAAFAVDNGSVWVSAAGNDGRRHWAGAFSNPDRKPGSNDRFHNFYFGPDGNDELNALGDADALTSDDDLRTLEPGDRIDVLLEWDDWPSRYDGDWRNESADFALRLYNSSGLVTTADRSHDEFGQPLETLRFTVKAADTYSLAITNVSDVPADGSGPELELYTFGDTYKPQYRTPAGSLLAPAAREEVTTVGAAFHETGELEAYSSRGPTDDGRRGVDLLGPDGTASDALGEPFFGSSAAAAHVGGTAALVRAANGSLSAAAVDARLTATAVDVTAGPATEGPDPATGFGRVDARAAVAPDVSVAGRLVAADGAPVVDRVVAARTDGRTARGRTDGTGRFDVPRPAPARPVDVGLASGTPGDGVPDVHAVARVTAPGERRLGERALPAAGPGTVRVVDDGTAVANASVAVTHVGPDGAAVTVEGRTDADGRLVVDGATRLDAVGNLTIRARSPATGASGVVRTRVAPGTDWNATVALPSAARWAVDGLDAPSTVTRGDEATVSARLTHVDGAASDETTVSLRVDANRDGRLTANETVAERTVTVPVGDARRVSFGFDGNVSREGSYRVGVVAAGPPAPNATTTATTNVTVEARGAILNVTSLTAPGTAVAGELVPVDVRVRNEGDSRTDDDVIELRADLDGNGAVEPDEVVTIGNVVLGAGNATTVRLSLNTSGFDARTYRIGVFSRTAGDSVGSSLTVRTRARHVPSVVDAPERARRGQPLRVTARVTNEGGTVGPTTPVDLRIDADGDGRLAPDETVDSTDVTLAPGANRTVTLVADTAALRPGEYLVGVDTADGTGAFRTRLVRAPARTVVARADGPAAVPRNATVSVAATVRNDGGTAGNETTVALRIDVDRDGRFAPDETVDGTTVRLDRGESTRVDLAANASAMDLGDHYYGFEVRTVNDSRSIRVRVGDPAVFPDGVPGAGDDPPTDVDGDARLEDVNGDGRLTFTDVVDLLFVDRTLLNADPDRRAAFDFDGNGRVTFLDVVALLFEV